MILVGVGLYIALVVAASAYTVISLLLEWEELSKK
jgi:hypothetical protein